MSQADADAEVVDVEEYGLAPLRVRGLAKVHLHADLTLLARLSQTLARVRDIQIAAYVARYNEVTGPATRTLFA